MYATSSVATQLATFYADIGTGLSTAIVQILVGMAALLVLGFAIRHVIRRITGRKF